MCQNSKKPYFCQNQNFGNFPLFPFRSFCLSSKLFGMLKSSGVRSFELACRENCSGQDEKGKGKKGGALIVIYWVSEF